MPATTASHQDMALHRIAATKVLLMIGTAVQVSEVAAGPIPRLLSARRNHHLAAQSSNPGADLG